MVGKKSSKEDINVQSVDSDETGDEGEEDYVVERVVDKKTHKGKVCGRTCPWFLKQKKNMKMILFFFQTQYFIKWEGYPDSENTWEPVENLDCDELLEQFEKNLQKKKERRSTKDHDKSKDREKDVNKHSAEKERKKRDSVSLSEDKESSVSIENEHIHMHDAAESVFFFY